MPPPAGCVPSARGTIELRRDRTWLPPQAPGQNTVPDKCTEEISDSQSAEQLGHRFPALEHLEAFVLLRLEQALHAHAPHEVLGQLVEDAGPFAEGFGAQLGEAFAEAALQREEEGEELGIGAGRHPQLQLGDEQRALERAPHEIHEGRQAVVGGAERGDAGLKLLQPAVAEVLERREHEVRVGGEGRDERAAGAPGPLRPLDRGGPLVPMLGQLLDGGVEDGGPGRRRTLLVAAAVFHRRATTTSLACRSHVAAVTPSERSWYLSTRCT